MTQDWTAWAAGLFEGEGTVHFSHSTVYKGVKVGTGSARAALATTDRDIALRFHQVVEVGRMYGPYEKKGTTKPQYEWKAFGSNDVSAIFVMFVPYLGERRTRQFLSVLMYCRPSPARKKDAPSCGRYSTPIPCAQGAIIHYSRGERPCSECRACRNLYHRRARKLKALLSPHL